MRAMQRLLWWLGHPAAHKMTRLKTRTWRFGRESRTSIRRTCSSKITTTTMRTTAAIIRRKQRLGKCNQFWVIRRESWPTWWVSMSVTWQHLLIITGSQDQSIQEVHKRNSIISESQVACTTRWAFRSAKITTPLTMAQPSNPRQSLCKIRCTKSVHSPRSESRIIEVVLSVTWPTLSIDRGIRARVTRRQKSNQTQADVQHQKPSNSINIIVMQLLWIICWLGIQLVRDGTMRTGDTTTTLHHSNRQPTITC